MIPDSIGSGPGYDEALTIVTELREIADVYDERRAFEERFRLWVQPHLRRPALVKRLRDEGFSVPGA